MTARTAPDPAARLLRALLAVWLAVAAAACASLPQQFDRPASQALSDPGRTRLGAAVAAVQPRATASGFFLIADGGDAFEARRLLADRATRTLDLQYYLMHDDAPTRALLASVRAAADRGVRVRVLLDDIGTEGRDLALSSFSAHRNIELRLFNPFPGERSNLATRLLSAMGSLSRLNRRMHNKAFIADNAVGITGGRNLGAEYFRQSDRVNFADLDILAAGPVVRDMSATFDRFWNSPQAYPVEAFALAARQAPEVPAAVDDPPPGAAVESPGAGVQLAAAAPVPMQAPPVDAPSGAATMNLPAPIASSAARGASLAGQLGRFGTLTWAPAFLLADAPTKIEFGADSGDELLIAEDLAALMRGAKREVIIVSPYFVPGRWGMELMRELRGRGVRVRVLTNSLAATDVPIVHAGYARYRRELLDIGVELAELHSMPGRQRGLLGLFGSSRASLHAKAAVIDRHIAFVGTLNLDPRSIRLNTEMGVVADSPALAQQLVTLYEQSAAPENSFRPQLAADGSGIEWVGSAGGVERRLRSEPEAGFWRLVIERVLGPFAPDQML